MRFQLPITCFALVIVLAGCAKQEPQGDMLVQEGVTLQKQSNFAAAVPKFEAALSSPLKVFKEWEVHNHIGSCYDSLDKFSEAIAAYEKSIALDPRNANVWANKGVSHRLSGDNAKAEECYLKAIELDPGFANAHGSLGVLYIMMGKPEKAVESLQKSVDLNPSLGTVHGNLALALGMVGSFDEAEKELNKAVSLGYPNADAIRERLSQLRKTMSEN